MRTFLLLISISFFSTVVSGQDKSVRWFPKTCRFPLLEYDLLEVQPYAGMHFLKAEHAEFDGLYIPINIGFRKSALQWDMFNMQFDLAMGAAAYTQFEVIRFDENTLRGGLLNTDFKASGFLFASKNQHAFRLQLFHVSSHLGDDYMLRNGVFEGNDKSVNYEQIDITYAYRLERFDLYGGVGMVITGNAYRDRFMAQLGFQANIPVKEKMDFSFGSDLKLYEENSFQPDVHAALGITLKQESQHQVNFSIDSYVGNLPYSTLDFGHVFWIGLSTRVYL